MRSFYQPAQSGASDVRSVRTPSRLETELSSGHFVAGAGASPTPAHVARTARIAVYDAMTSSPRVEDIASEDPRSLIEMLSERTYSLARERGGKVPYTVVREVTENLLHAAFSDVVVSILDDGSTIRFSDRGPGIGDKERAFLPGFTTADDTMRRYIRGVGSGLPIVRESVGFSGGFVEIEDNLGSGTVVTINVPAGSLPAGALASVEPEVTATAPGAPGSTSPASSAGRHTDLDFSEDSVPVLGVRQKQVLSLVMEMGSLGPTIVSRELKVGLSTAYRDLAFLEEAGLLSSDATGKRVLTDKGIDYLDALTG